MLLATAAQMRELDRHTIEDLGVPGAVLMDAAGRAVADLITREAPGAPTLVVAGPGNNGGDGFVVARHLANRGTAVEVLLVGDDARVRGDARVHLEAARKSGVGVRVVSTGAELEEAAARARVLVDALFGTGLERPLTGLSAAAVGALNARRAAGALTVAVDIPSGLHADRGVPLGGAVEADHTVTFALPKRGLVIAPGFTFVGQLHVADIGIPTRGPAAAGLRARLLDDGVLAPLGHDTPLGHKGTHGHLLVVAGSAGKTGAALLAGLGALRAGAGLCTLATPEAVLHAVEGRVPELMTARFEPGDDPAPLLAGKRALAVGPGLATSDEARGTLAQLLRAAAQAGLRIVIDADGLNHLAADPSLLDGVRGVTDVVLTPHPGEAGRLLGRTAGDVEGDRTDAVEELVRRTGCVVALKGARTMIAAPDGRLAVNPTGNPGMGTGGTGDVLTGVTGACLLVPELGAFEAASAAVYLHGAAGDDAAAARGRRGLLAGDVADALPAALARRTAPLHR